MNNRKRLDAINAKFSNNETEMTFDEVIRTIANSDDIGADELIDGIRYIFSLMESRFDRMCAEEEKNYLLACLIKDTTEEISNNLPLKTADRLKSIDKMADDIKKNSVTMQ